MADKIRIRINNPSHTICAFACIGDVTNCYYFGCPLSQEGFCPEIKAVLAHREWRKNNGEK